MTLSIQSILIYFFIALIALPLPLLMLTSPIHDAYKNFIRRKRINTVKKFFERPFALSEEQLSEIFPGIKSGQPALNDIYFEEDFSGSDL